MGVTPVLPGLRVGQVTLLCRNGFASGLEFNLQLLFGFKNDKKRARNQADADLASHRRHAGNHAPARPLPARIRSPEFRFQNTLKAC